MKKEREHELLLKGAMSKVTEILKAFNETMNSTLGDTVTITSNEGTETRKSTLQDTIDFYQDEWCNTVELLDEIGIDLEEDDNITPINTNVNHKAIYEELQLYAVRADSNGATSYLEYKNIQIPYKNIYMTDDISGGSMLIPYMGENIDESAAAFILLDKNTEYKIIDKIGEGEQPVLTEK